VTWGVGSSQELATAGADVIIDTPAELVPAINDLLS
jgi:phosphoglycolate phosphatase-like HAD superfamily hydrolase